MDTRKTALPRDALELYRVHPDRLRRLFRQFNRVMVLMFRLGLGAYIGNRWTGYIMVITTTGRKSGLRRHTPVDFLQGDGEVYCNLGFGTNSDWYRNVQANPQVEVWLGSKAWLGRAEIVPTEEARPLYRKLLERAGFADRAFTKVNLSALGDEDLGRLPGAGPLLRIRLERELPAPPDRPGDLAWVWPVAIGAYLWGRCARRHRRSR